MKFYTQNHMHYCGIDLHARSMYICKKLASVPYYLARYPDGEYLGFAEINR